MYYSFKFFSDKAWSISTKVFLFAAPFVVKDSILYILKDETITFLLIFDLFISLNILSWKLSVDITVLFEEIIFLSSDIFYIYWTIFLSVGTIFLLVTSFFFIILNINYQIRK